MTIFHDDLDRPRDAAVSGPHRIVFLVTEDWYFVSHRLPMARAARDAGFEVHVAAREGSHGARIRAEGFIFHPLRWRRRSLNPLEALRAVMEIARLYVRLAPDLAHHVAIKPIVLGGLAASLARVPAVVGTVAGLGYVFTAETVKARAIRALLVPALRLALDRPGHLAMVQNEDDGALLVRRGAVAPSHLRLVRGSGLDLDAFPVLPEPPAPPVTIATATRMLRIKGVEDLVAAFRLLRDRGLPVRLLLAGAPDPDNHAAIGIAELKGWASEPGIVWLGAVADVRTVWAQAHIAVLASRGGEGVPKTLLEAASCGRPLCATDVPGCRDVALPDRSGLLAPPGDPAALAASLARLVEDSELRRRLGTGARALVAERFDGVRVGRDTVAAYRALLGPAAPPRRS